MEVKFKNGEDFYYKIFLRFNALIALTLLPMAWMLLQKQVGQLIPVQMDNWSFYLILFVLNISSGVIIYQSRKNYSTLLGQIQQLSGMREKMATYYAISMKKYVQFMLASIICLAGYYVTVHFLFIITYVTIMILLSLSRPTLVLITDDLRLNNEEVEILQQKKEIV